ncbi:MAG: ATP-binding protein [Cytophagaceae bacterium]
MHTQAGYEHMVSLFPKLIAKLEGIAIFMMNKEGEIVTWNQGCEQLKGYKENEALGKNYEMLFPEFLKEKNDPKEELKEAEKAGRFEEENWRRKKSGELFWAQVILTKLHDESGEFVGFVKITQDRTLRKHYYDELQKKNKKLERTNHELMKLNRELDTFVYSASHDLKAPISNMNSLLSLLESEISEKSKENPQVQKLTDMMKTCTERLYTNISDLAYSAKIDSEKKGYSEQSFKEILEDIMYSLNDQILTSKAVIQEEILEPKIKFSRKNIRSILYNLISNAIKYRSPERNLRVIIRTEKTDEYTLLTVADNGIGIKEEDKKNVFSMYQRLEANQTEGSGVGMAIVAQIVDANGGEIKIDSEPGKGSTFKVYLKNKES